MPDAAARSVHHERVFDIWHERCGSGAGDAIIAAEGGLDSVAPSDIAKSSPSTIVTALNMEQDEVSCQDTRDLEYPPEEAWPTPLAALQYAAGKVA